MSGVFLNQHFSMILRQEIFLNSDGRSHVKSLLATYSDWPFSKTYSKSNGSTVRGFRIFFSNLSNSLRNLIRPSPNLINTESRTEETSTAAAQCSFYPGQQQTEKNIKSYNIVPQKYFINES